jgi:hypothetical protein
MATTEERLKILQMIQEGKITAEEGAKLLSALSSSARSRKPVARGPGSGSKARWLRVRVTDMSSGKSKVNVNLPLSLIDAGLNIAGHFADDLDSEDLMAAIHEALNENLSGKIIDVVDGDDGEHVEIFIE